MVVVRPVFENTSTLYYFTWPYKEFEAATYRQWRREPVESNTITKEMIVYSCTVLFPCYDVRYGHQIKGMFGSFLPPVVSRRANVWSMLFVFVCVYSGVQQVLAL